mgnify:CR=1 FL=1
MKGEVRATPPHPRTLLDSVDGIGPVANGRGCLVTGAFQSKATSVSDAYLQHSGCLPTRAGFEFFGI